MKHVLLFLPILLVGLVGRMSGQVTISVANSGFESAVSSGLPSTFGTWAGDQNVKVGTENGISPLSGSGMLSLIKTAPDGIDVGTGADSLQLVDISSFASSISAGTFTVTLSASFNRTASTHTQFQVGIRAYSGLVSNFPSETSLTAIANQFTTLTSDSNLTTWESLSASLLLPTNTSYIAIWVSALSATGNLATLPDGHYADEVTLTAVPEPSTYALLAGLGALGAVVYRRRTVRR